ncbi:hypothetical protein MIZ01_1786 [Sideroxyarcus emersonii]|uniref:Uncharacterized protein n=1 Tax=Sideroxyarcus emersonii TaxID=2764705 RepID=A0AAN1XAW7_9PROT|nr:hypothetical protein MIZ01_1786 [Sideroxyarcus emersonii]
MRFPSARTCKTLVCLSLAAALWVPLLVLGDEVPVSPPEMVGPPPEMAGPPLPPAAPQDAANMLDTPRDYLSGKLVGLVSSIDRFFGDDRHYQESNDSVFEMDVNRVAGYAGQPGFTFSGRANVHLPIAEQKLHLLLETNPDKNAVVDPTQIQQLPQQPNEPAAQQSFGAALRFMQQEAERWHLSADGGLKFQGLSTTPFARTRASVEMSPLEEWRVKLTETAFWFNTIGAGETTQMDIDHTISEPVLFRATSSANWLNNTQNFDLRQDLTVFHTLDERRAMMYQASAIGVSQPTTQVIDYVVLMQYRYRLHRKWMFFDFSPQLHFPRERQFRPSPQFSFRLEMLFDELK